MALAVSGLSFHFTEDRMPEVAKQLVAAAEEISQRNGCPRKG